MSSALIKLFNQPPFALKQSDKEQLLLPLLIELTAHHREFSDAYRRIIDLTAPKWMDAKSLKDIPYLPISLFKYRRLRSIPEKEVKVTITSSGTSGAGVSHVDLDSKNARLAASALSSIMKSITHGQRLPLLVIDCADAINSHERIGARASAILGMMPYGRDVCFALENDFSLAAERVRLFLQKHAGAPMLIYGFTYIVWQFFLNVSEHEQFDLSNGVLLHSGGWKKLSAEAVSAETFKKAASKKFALKQIMNFYGMAELPGTIFLENSDGLLSVPSFAEVIIRDSVSFDVLPDGSSGLIQVLNLLPHSYPGHSLLTEDIGVIETVDSGVGNRFAKAIRVIGRAPRAELRGCSDVLAAKWESQQ